MIVIYFETTAGFVLFFIAPVGFLLLNIYVVRTTAN